MVLTTYLFRSGMSEICKYNPLFHLHFCSGRTYVHSNNFIHASTDIQSKTGYLWNSKRKPYSGVKNNMAASVTLGTSWI